jgi:glycosyltransferase involved in cell wall biosynthesis
MLARLLRHQSTEDVCLISLMGISERNRKLAENSRVTFIALGARSMLQFAMMIPRLRDIIRERKPSAVMCWMYHAMIAGTLAHRMAKSSSRLIWNVRQSLDDPTSLTRSTRIAVAIAKRLSKLPETIAYNSKRARDLHSTYGYSSRRTLVIPNGFLLPEQKAIKPKRPITFGTAARYHSQKDYPSLFKAAAEVLKTHKAAKFVAVGKGVSWGNPEAANAARNAGLDTEDFDLRDETNEMPAFFNSIDVFVLSSRTEGFPNVVAEAMSHGKPVIATDVGEAAAIVADTGLVVLPQNPIALANAMRGFLDMEPEAYEALARAARFRIENTYALDRVIVTYQALFEGSSEHEGAPNG